jgi:single-stranded DNA-specific DHH superfamily exonuclease
MTLDLSGIKVVISHDNCADGKASAILIHDAIPTAEILFHQYGNDEYRNMKAEPGMLFVDFSPPPERAQEFVDAGAIVLDHHKSAKETVAKFGNRGVFADELENPGVCGATLAFREVWKVLRGYRRDDPCIHVASFDRLSLFAERFAMLAGVYDTWQRQSPFWEEARAQKEVLSFMPWERWSKMYLSDISENWRAQFQWVGEVLIEKDDQSTEKTVKGARRFTTSRGTRVAIFEGSTKSSSVAEYIGSDADLAAGFSFFEEDTDQGRVTKMVVSTRSRTTYNCSALAKLYGGGGHTKAAGFNITLHPNTGNPYAVIEYLIEEFERAPSVYGNNL